MGAKKVSYDESSSCKESLQSFESVSVNLNFDILLINVAGRGLVEARRATSL